MPRPPPPAAAFTISGGSSASGIVGTPASAAMRFAASLSPPARSASGGGPTQVRPAACDRLGEVTVLGEEAVAGVDGIGARSARGADVLLGGEVRRDLDRLVGGACVQRAGVVGRDDRDGAEPELARGAKDAQRDLAAVRDQHLLHARQPNRRRAGR